jgi:predicted metal-dependent phosphoesterase TrpH
VFETVRRRRLLKTELHAHTNQDPCDALSHSTRDLIDHAAALRYDALAITLHDRYFDAACDTDYARQRGLTLISGIERTIGGKHVLLINFSAACERVRTFADIATLRRAEPHGLVVAPHPLYPHPSSLGQAILDQHADLFDAVEVNAMFTKRLNFNRAAMRWARHAGKPLVGNSDVHLLDQLNHTYSLVDADPTPDAICDAIRAGRVEVLMQPSSVPRVAWIFGRMLLGGGYGRIRRLFRSKSEPASP